VRPDLRQILDDLPELSDILERAAQRYVDLGRLGGTVKIAPFERRAVDRLGCRVDSRGRLKLIDLEHVFRTSRLGTGLLEVLEELRGGPIVTRAEAREREERAWRDLRSGVTERGAHPWLDEWLDEQAGTLRSEWRRYGDDWVAELEVTVRAARDLEAIGEAPELPHFAYRVCGDAHGLDSDRTAGRLFERLLAHRHADAGFSFPLSAEDRETLFALAGLAIDELSSTVHAAGLGGSDPVMSAARQARRVVVLPLRTLYAIGDDVWAQGGVVFAVENRSVLSRFHRQLADVPVERYPTLVCTGGHMSLATLRLLERLAASGAVVRYSGDFDARGLMIAAALSSRLGPAFRPWRLDTGGFFEALRRRGGCDQIDPGPFSLAAAARFPELAQAIAEHGAAFQEGLSDVLLDDVRRWIDER